MAKSLEELQTPIFDRIAHALLKAIPDHWPFAVLELLPAETGKHIADSTYGHCIWNDNFPDEDVFATDEIFEATGDLQQLCESFKNDWKRLSFRVRRVSEGYRYTVDVER